MLSAITIFLSAFLLFEAEPLVARSILPWFGGSAAVWTTCLLFFQVVLLGGYAYAHVVSTRFAPRVQARLHSILLAVSVLTLPILPRESLKPTGATEPIARILLTLALTVGLPYLLLSTTGPLLQRWIAAKQAAEPRRAAPYRLYALSNIGSMLALLSYPTVVEPLLALRTQAWLWSGGYIVFAVMCFIVARQAASLPAMTAEIMSTDEETDEDEGVVPLSRQRANASARQSVTLASPRMGDYAQWVALSAVASVLLLAVSNHLTQNVAAIPLLWVMPLSLYLLSFIVCFGETEFTFRPAFLPLPLAAIALMGYAAGDSAKNLPINTLIPLFAFGLFVCCVLCHGELARRKPPVAFLTGYYLAMSVGGALGGVFVGLIAPVLFRGYYELPIAIVACGVIALFALYRDGGKQWHRDPYWIALAVGVVWLGRGLARDIWLNERENRLTVRNFYGVLQVSDSTDDDGTSPVRTLTHGTITHGRQYLDTAARRTPSTYYGVESGIGRTIRALQTSGAIRVGVVGLGTGTIAAYGRAGDTYTFYDINPLVPKIAREQFSYITDTRAEVNMVLGDARLSMEHQPSQQFDVLAIDAFSSDAIPVHLLTREAFAVYFRHLKPNGILCLHVSNRYLDLKPVVRAAADAFGKEARLVQEDGTQNVDSTQTEWVLVASRPFFFALAPLRDAAKPLDARSGFKLWTDDYSNLFQIRN